MGGSDFTIHQNGKGSLGLAFILRFYANNVVLESSSTWCEINLIQKYFLNAWYVLVGENSTVKRYPLEDSCVKKDTPESITYMRLYCKLLRSE